MSVSWKIEEYFAIGVQQVWIVEPRNRAVVVYRSPTEVQSFVKADTIVGAGILDGLSIPVASLLPEPDEP
jgi:Uma2 family endonuclease